MAEAGWVAPEEPDRTEVFAFVSQGVRVRACVCARLCIPAGCALRRLPAASLPVPPSPAWPVPPFLPGLSHGPSLPELLPGMGSHRLQVPAGLPLGLHRGFAARGAASEVVALFGWALSAAGRGAGAAGAAGREV